MSRIKLTIGSEEYIGGREFIIHTVTAAEDTANSATIATDFKKVDGAHVTIIRSGETVSTAAAISFSAGNIVIADGTTAYVVTTADVLYITAYGRNDA